MAAWKGPKGTQDLCGNEYDRLESLTTIIREQFVLNGGRPLDTPVFERKDVLMGKYGEEAETKLVYNIEANGGEPLTLRYDLTIPFIRYVKENNIVRMRRYAIGKVYRRDQPNLKSGRFREFYQADFDILGEDNETMAAECTLLQMACAVLDQLSITNYEILINDTQNLKELLVSKANIAEDKWKAMCPIIDKLDKQSFESLIPQFLEIDPAINTTILKECLSITEPVSEIVKERWDRLTGLASVFGFRDKLRFTSSLARGLDYYSGFIWEIKTESSQSTIIAGGRYDTLINKSLVGISFGVSRMLSLLPLQIPKDEPWNETMFVTTIGDVPILERMLVVSRIKSMFPKRPVLYGLSEKDKKLGKVLEDCIRQKYRYVVIVPEDEWKAKSEIIIKDLAESTQMYQSLCL